MIVNIKRVFTIGTCLAVVLSLFVGCSALTNKKTSSNITSSASSRIVKRPEISPASFSTIKNYVKSTLYENVEGAQKNTTVSGKCDLNGDGKKDNIKISYKKSGDAGKILISVGSSKLQLNDPTPDSTLEGVYTVDLDKSLKYIDLAVAVDELDADVSTTFYRYDGSLKLEGTVYGSFVDKPYCGYNLKAYNIGILADGHGRLIPRLGVMRYVSPQIMLSAYEIQNGKIEKVKLDTSKAINKTYTVTSDEKPYFEQMSKIPSNFTPKYDTSDIISLKKGSTVTFSTIGTSMNDSFCSSVQLQNKKKGMLYFFVHP